MIQQIVQKIYVRPIRQKYFLHDLGPKCYSFEPQTYASKQNNFRHIRKSLEKVCQLQQINSEQIKRLAKRIKREDHIISTPNTEELHVSFYKSEHESSQSHKSQSNLGRKSQTTLIYLHTHNGSKLEGLNLVEPILSTGINFCTFDFSGYGNSKGSHVSLGVREIYDLQRVIQFLEERFEQVAFILWGRSMGAVTALRYLSSQLYEQDQYNILGAIYDSPFSSIQKLTYEMSSKSLNIPKALLTPLVMLIKSTLKQKLPFEELQMDNLVQKINVPCIFIASKNDSFISYEHSERLYSQYNCRQKEILFIERNHNELRNFQDLAQVYEFIGALHRKNLTKQDTILKNILNTPEFYLSKIQLKNNKDSLKLVLPKKITISRLTMNQQVQKIDQE